MEVLYQKYRPQNFNEIFGQNHIKTILKNEIINNKLSHAYLFCGPRAVGKTTMARVLAKSINCQNRKEKEHEPCNTCNSCVSINNFNNLEIIEIDAASNTGVDNVRDNIISLSKYVSSTNKYKVFIIDEVHMLSISAFNALLKTLEEPPKNVVFVLCTTETHKVPLTIISRCEKLDFKKITVSDIVIKLEKILKKENIKAEKEVLELIAITSGGHLRDAESLLSQIISISEKEIDLKSAHLVIPRSNVNENIKLIEFLSKKDAILAIELLNQQIEEGINLNNLINELIELFRKMILNKVKPSLASKLGLDLSEKMEIKISKISSDFNIEQLILLTELFTKSIDQIKTSSIPQLAVELAIIKYCDYKQENKTNKITKDKTEEHNEKQEINDILLSAEDLSDIEGTWSEFLKQLKPHNHSLSFVMQSSKLIKIENKKIYISFKYKLHKERLEKPEIQDIIKKVLKDVYKEDLSIEALVDNKQTLKPENPKKDDTLDNILKTFGGQVIN